MTYQEGRRPSEGTQQAIDREIRGLFDSDAAETIIALRDAPMCIITGPFGIGKSTILIPAITNLLRQQGRSTLKIPGGVTASSPEELPYFFEEIPDPTRGVAIVDEAGSYRTEQQRVQFLRTARDSGFGTVIPVIAYDIDTDAGNREATAWQQAGATVSERPTQEIPVVHLPVRELSVDLARRFLVARGEFFNTPPEVVDYVLKIIPRTIKVLDQVSGGRNLQITQAAILANCPNWVGAFPHAQVRQIEARVHEDIRSTS